MPVFRRRDMTVLAVASVVSGLLAYLFFSLATRALGGEAAAPVAVLWTYWSAATAMLTFPIQHWIARTVEAEGGEAGIRRALPQVGGVVLVVAAVAGTVAWLLRAQLFHRDDAGFPLLIALVTLGSAFIGVIRGQLSARRRFHALSVALISENATRCLAAGALFAAGVTTPAAYGLALALGPVIGFAWPSCLRLARTGNPSTQSAALAFLGGFASGSLLGQFILTGGPVVLSLTGGSPTQVTALFATLALFRAPYTLSIGVVSQVTGYLTALVAAGRDAALRRIRVALVVGALATAALAFALGWLIGPTLVTAVFGPDVGLPRPESALAAAGSAFAVANLVAMLVLVALGQSSGVLRSWLIGSAIGAAALLVDLEPVMVVVLAFVLAEAAAFIALSVYASRTTTVMARESQPGPLAL